MKRNIKLVVVYAVFNYVFCGGYLYLKEMKRWAVGVLTLMSIYGLGFLFRVDGKLPFLLIPFVLGHIIFCTFDGVRIAKEMNAEDHCQQQRSNWQDCMKGIVRFCA